MKVQWQEPVEFFRAYMKSTGTVPTRRGRILAGIIAAAVVALLTLAFEKFFFLLHGKDLGVPGYFYYVAPAIVGFVVWLFPTMLLAIPATIVLNERGVYRIKPFGSELSVDSWPWESITEMAVEDVQYGEATFRVLVVRSRLVQGDMLFGLGSAPLERIGEVAAQMGKTLVNRVA
jgi:hypothetical protein